MDRETSVFVAVLFVLLLYVITGSELVLALISSLAVLYILPLDHLPKLLGYLVISDVLFSVWFASVASATLGGLQLAALTGLVYAVVSRELRQLWGTERIAINGKTSFHDIFAELSTYTISWFSAIFAGVKSGKVQAPTSLNIGWVVETPPGGWAATRTHKAIQALFNKFKWRTQTA